jgi:putative ABC transport system permease protein
VRVILPLSLALQLAAPQLRTIAIDARLAADAHLRVGDTVIVAATPTAVGSGDRAVIAAIVERNADPSEVARSDYRIRLHLDHLQSLAGYGDRVDRFAVLTKDSVATERALATINEAAFGFRAHRSKDIAVQTSGTFRVVSRFHKAIGIITIVASAIFLLCIMLLKVDERRRDIAALRLLGVSRASIVRSVVLEASAIALLGSALGVVIGYGAAGVTNWYYQGLYRTPLRFAVITGDVITLAVGLSLVLGIGAGFIAAQRLVRTPPLTLLGR